MVALLSSFFVEIPLLTLLLTKQRNERSKEQNFNVRVSCGD
jgi:hypothetical protein